MPGLFGADEVRRVAEAAMNQDGADGVEVLLLHEWGGLTRFASSAIHQSTSKEDTGVRVRVVQEGRVGVAASNDFTPEGAARAAASALEMAHVVPPDPMFPGMAPPAETQSKPEAFDEATAATSPTQRAELVAGLIGQVGGGFRAAGALDTAAAEIALANTEGQFCYAPFTQSTVTTVVSGGDGGAGAAEATAKSLGELDPVGIGADASRRARDSQRPQPLAPGRYEVVLEPLAVSTLVAFLGYMGFSGRAILEGRSPFSGKAGQKVCGDNVTLVDDALTSETIGIPFDFEGTPKQRVTLIDHGTFVTGVHDRRSAKQAGVEPTGHALPPPNPEGAFPLNLTLETGDASLDDMIRATKRGLLVTRFHYSNIVHPIETTITGMTRDGTWWIEDGEVAHPVQNLRFTQSILEALSNVELIGRDAAIASEFFFAASRVPALKVSAFTFSGASDH
jgi:predicted Zn-dependent protease